MAANFIALSYAFDVGYSLETELSNLLRRKVPLILLAESKSLFDVTSKGTHTSEKSMMLDIAAARERYCRGDISSIGFVRSLKNLADGLTKTNEPSESLAGSEVRGFVRRTRSMDYSGKRAKENSSIY